MNTKLSKLMTLFGLCAMGFYAIMLSSGSFSLNVMPQLVISAVMFLSSGRIMRKVAKRIRAGQGKDEEDDHKGIDFQLLGWVIGLFVLMVVSLLLLVPFGVSLEDTYFFRITSQLFDSGFIP